MYCFHFGEWGSADNQHEKNNQEYLIKQMLKQKRVAIAKGHGVVPIETIDTIVNYIPYFTAKFLLGEEKADLMYPDSSLALKQLFAEELREYLSQPVTHEGSIFNEHIQEIERKDMERRKRKVAKGAIDMFMNYQTGQEREITEEEIQEDAIESEVSEAEELDSEEPRNYHEQEEGYEPPF